MLAIPFITTLIDSTTGDLNTFPRIALIIGHLVGIVLGVGGATVSDVFFFKSIKDGKITDTEYDTLITITKLIWTGLVILALSGFGFLVLAFTAMPELWEAGYSADKILMKLIITAIIAANGMVFHIIILPMFEAHLNQPLITPHFNKTAPLLFTSGAISGVSWWSALILGAWRGLQAPFLTLLGVYLILLIGAIIVSNIMGFGLRRSFKKRFSSPPEVSA